MPLSPAKVDASLQDAKFDNGNGSTHDSNRGLKIESSRRDAEKAHSLTVRPHRVASPRGEALLGPQILFFPTSQPSSTTDFSDGHRWKA
jgi:hypothetical protein